jgi:hypothetical protein
MSQITNITSDAIHAAWKDRHAVRWAGQNVLATDYARRLIKYRMGEIDSLKYDMPLSSEARRDRDRGMAHLAPDYSTITIHVSPKAQERERHVRAEVLKQVDAIIDALERES